MQRLLRGEVHCGGGMVVVINSRDARRYAEMASAGSAELQVAGCVPSQVSS